MNDTSKNPTPAARVIRAKNEKGEDCALSFQNGVVPEDGARCAGWTFEEDADFSGLIFEGAAVFKKAVFKGKADFSNALFKAQVNFAEALFERDAVFENAQFSGEGSEGEKIDVNFYRCGFGIEEKGGEIETGQPKALVSFSSAQFHNTGDVSFKEAEFHNAGSVSFWKGQFHNTGAVWFASAQFHNTGDVWFYETQFHNTGDVWFWEAQFHNKESLNLIYLVFINGGDLNCEAWSFRDGQEADFNHCLFLSKEETRFQNLRASANGQLRFTKCLFALTPRVDFSKSQFESTVFEGGKFDPNFDWNSLPTERKDVKALVKKVKKKIEDEGEFFCEVFGLPDRKEKSWADEFNDFSLKISEAIFKYFRWLFTRKAKQKEAEPATENSIGPYDVDFTGLSSESAKNLTFRLTNLSGARFDGLTLSHVQLNAPGWAEYDDRAALRQEIALRQKKGELTDDEYRDLSDQYTQLKINLERQGHYRDSGKFHISEQELTRDYNWKHGKYHVWLFHSLYKWLSGYGEQPFRAIACFAALLALFSTVIACMTPDLDAAPYTGWEWVKHGFVKILKTGLSLITPFKGLWFEHMTVENYGVYIVRFIGQVSILAIQLPLMILAIRRWFKR